MQLRQSLVTFPKKSRIGKLSNLNSVLRRAIGVRFARPEVGVTANFQKRAGPSMHPPFKISRSATAYSATEQESTFFDNFACTLIGPNNEQK